jgi:hypothetical protein
VLNLLFSKIYSRFAEYFLRPPIQISMIIPQQCVVWYRKRKALPNIHSIAHMFLACILVVTLYTGIFYFQPLLQAQTTSTTIQHNPDQSLHSTQKFLAAEYFRYANHQRYTLHGDLPLLETDIDVLNASIVGGTYFGILGALHIYQANTIWNETSSFRFIEDGDYGLYADKFGHATGAHFLCYISSEALMASGLSWDASVIWGSAMGVFYMTYVEVADGFGANWGFSPTDMYANLAGVSLFLGQHYVPFLQNFTLKTTFLPATWYGEKKRPTASSVIDDYSAYTWWLSMNVHNMMPESWQQNYPSWLHVSVGYAARSLDTPQESQRYILALDVDMRDILPKGPSWWNWIVQSLNYIKLPAPAVEFSPTHRPRYYLIYPFQIGIGL